MRNCPPELRIGIVLTVAGLTYAGLILHARRASRTHSSDN
jgi:hypothetical protein